MEKCQSCKIKPVEIIEPCDNENYPYKLCNECHQRLINRALRPLEYFNLTARQGRTYLLHNDFYGEKGETWQAGIKIKEENSLVFPKLDAVNNDLEWLIDYAIVMWRVSKEVVEEFQKFNPVEILDSFKQRIEENRGLGYRIYELAAKVSGPVAADWIRSEWKYRTLDNLQNYSDCLARCLPLEEGFGYYTDELDKIDSPSVLTDNLIALIYFQSALSLNWIEKNINRVTNISGVWGSLAVASQFDWARAKKWLDSGRPLSLVSLDALANCAVTKETQYSSIWLNNNPQRLLDPDPIDKMNAVLAGYLSKDNVTRVRNKIDFITGNWDSILKITE